MGACDYQIVIDLEFNPTRAEVAAADLFNEIVEIGSVRLDSRGNAVDTYSCFVRPECNDAVAPKITALTSVGVACFGLRPFFPGEMSSQAASFREMTLLSAFLGVPVGASSRPGAARAL